MLEHYEITLRGAGVKRSDAGILPHFADIFLGEYEAEMRAISVWRQENFTRERSLAPASSTHLYGARPLTQFSKRREAAGVRPDLHGQRRNTAAVAADAGGGHWSHG